MRVRMLGQPVASYEFDEESGNLVVAGLAINLPEAEQDTENIITISMGDEGAVLGSEGRHGFIADIDIPPRRYTTEEYEDNEGNTTTKPVAVPFDPDRVVLRLWPLVTADEKQEDVNRGGM